MIIRLRITIQGFVQAVGFRPYIYHLAHEFHLSGWIKNNGYGVQIEAQGEKVEDFFNSITLKKPNHAVIESITKEEIELSNDECHFQILKSDASKVATKILPDIAPCDACLEELFDVNSRYYLYPFINCTHCGPRYSIVKTLPYDRKSTTMAAFILCEQCQQAYDNPLDRRFHAEPLACKHCGPRLSDDINTIVATIKAGGIVAIKNTGGYQLLCDAHNENALKKLRQRKNRPYKPFAVMGLNINTIKQYVNLDQQSKSLLSTWQRPIVIMENSKQTINEHIAPDLNQLGMMLPNSALHYLIFNGLLGFESGMDWLDKANDCLLICTSANPNALPLIKDESQCDYLEPIADLIVTHNREIYQRVDDSVIKYSQGRNIIIRRARSYVPKPIKLDKKYPAILALGSHLKNTLCFIREDEAFISQHIGDLGNKETVDFFQETILHMQKTLAIQAEVIAHDLHPAFFSTDLAKQMNLPCIAVQHHHAHIASVVAEHKIHEPILGLALDGYGYGLDGAAWGGELLMVKGAKFSRLAHLKTLAMPGGEKAALEPWRMGVSVLDSLGLKEEIARYYPQFSTDIILQMLQKELNCPQTSSCGRLFDAAASLLNINHVNHYESQSAQMLESLVSKLEVFDAGFTVEEGHLNLLPLFFHLLSMDKHQGANIFHGTLIAACCQWVQFWQKEFKINTIALGGGCFSNAILTLNLRKQLEAMGMKVLQAIDMPPNDGGLSLGQAYIAAQMP